MFFVSFGEYLRTKRNRFVKFKFIDNLTEANTLQGEQSTNRQINCHHSFGMIGHVRLHYGKGKR